jgi:hypothetical protein
MASRAFRSAFAALILFAASNEVQSVPTPSTSDTCLNWALNQGGMCPKGSALFASPSTLQENFCNPSAAGDCQARCCRRLIDLLPTFNSFGRPSPNPIRRDETSQNFGDATQKAAERSVRQTETKTQQQAERDEFQPPVPVLPPPTVPVGASVSCALWLITGGDCAQGTTVLQDFMQLVQLQCTPSAGTCQNTCCFRPPAPAPGSIEELLSRIG